MEKKNIKRIIAIVLLVVLQLMIILVFIKSFTKPKAKTIPNNNQNIIITNGSE